jgi:hypothetical protein
MDQQNGQSDGSKDLTKEQWREYQFGAVTYRIAGPQKLWTGATTHRVLDADGIVHCVPCVGERDCVLRWKPKDDADPVQF